MLARQDSEKVQTTAAGHGPLWQHDYWVTLERSTLSPADIVLLMRREFPEFAPDSIARFSRKDDRCTPVEVGDEMTVEIIGAGTCGILFTHVGEQSFTMRTLDGHFEAGRITFGAYREDGKTIIRIRSRARSASRRRHVAYLLPGRAMQEKVWHIFLQRIAAQCGADDAEVATRTQEVRGDLADAGEVDTPTFIAEDRS